MAAHAKLSPSAAYRWLKCPGAPALCATVPARPSGPYAMEGTAAHELAQECLKQYTNPITHKGEIIRVDGNPFQVDNDMAIAVKVYIDALGVIAPLGLVAEGHVIRAIEKQVQVTDEVWGTADTMIYDMRDKHLQVWDYKHGQGVMVSPVENEQMMCYGLGALKALMSKNVQVDKVTLVVCQPRTRSDQQIKPWETTPQHLLEWERDTLLPGIAATKAAGAPLCAGDHCKFCDAQATCSEQRKLALTVAQQEFDPISQTGGTPAFPAPETMTTEQLGKVLRYAELLNSWVAQVSAYAKQQADVGMCPGGYKLVAKRSNRAWIDKDNALFALEAQIGEEAFSKKVLSPAQAEKAFKAAGLDPASLACLYHKPDAGTTLVPVTDKRAALPSANAAEFLTESDFFS